MNQAVIDVGSNTIRMVIYKLYGEGFTEIAHERDFAGLITYVKDDILSDEGKDRIVATLSKMSATATKHACEKIHCFATASLRNVKNIDAVIGEIKEKTGIEMVIISGEDEAKYDFYGLMSGISASCGIGFDLGGGSCQIFKFKDRCLSFFKSLKIGGQVIYKKFVSGELPTPCEMQNIYQYITDSLAPLDMLKNADVPVIYAMGGAARNAAKFVISSENRKDPLDKYRLSRKKLVSLCEKIVISPEGREKLLRYVPDRLTTLVPGIITIIALMDFCRASEIEIVLQGVREGYVHEKILKLS